jgi:hypothetical protein
MKKSLSLLIATSFILGTFGAFTVSATDKRNFSSVQTSIISNNVDSSGENSVDSIIGENSDNSITGDEDLTIEIVDGDYTIELADDNDETATITDYNGTDSDIVIPSQISGYTVTAIGEYAFENNLSLVSVKIPNSITEIGQDAFAYSKSLVSVEIPDSVKKISAFMFMDCSSLKSVLMSRNVTEIETNAFWNCTSLTTIKPLDYPIGLISFPQIILPNDLVSMGTGAFLGCTAITNVVIPYYFQKIGDKVFADCTALNTVTKYGNTSEISDTAFDNCPELTLFAHEDSNVKTYAEEHNIPFYSYYGEYFDVKTSGDYSYQVYDDGTSRAVITRYNGTDTDIVIPSEIDGHPIVKLEAGSSDEGGLSAYSAFSNCTSIKNITIPDNISIIDDCMFYGCTSLEKVILPDKFITIDEYAFTDCTSLTSIDIPKTTTKISTTAFNGCTSLTEINVAEDNPNYTSINGILFSKDLTELITYPAGLSGEYVIPETVTKISENAFRDAGLLTDITIPNSVTEIRWSAFRGCSSLTEVTIPDSVTILWSAAFAYCTALESIILPYEIKYVDNYLFSNCTSLKSITIPDSVTVIRNGAFQGCTSLMSVTIPNNVKMIYGSAFKDCTSLTKITIPKNVTYIDEGDGGYESYFTFENCPNLTIYGYSGSEAELCAGKFSIPFVSIGKIENYGKEYEYTVLEDGTAAITGYTNIDYEYEIVVPSELDEYTVTAIGAKAFEGSILWTIIFPDSITTFDENAFSACYSLSGITIPKNVTSIGYNAFWDSNLRQIKVDEENPIFASVDGVLFDKEIKKLIAYPKWKIGECIIPNSVTEIADGAFSTCKSLTEITIPKNITAIGDNAFSDCEYLTEITIPNSVTEIGDSAFLNCKKLIIYGYTGSYAETYAGENKIPFVPIDKTQYIYGDIDRDYNVGMTDFIIVAKIVHSKAVFAEELLTAADLNEDNIVNSIDLALIKYRLLNSKTLTEKEKLQLEELRQKGEQNFGKYWWQEKVLLGEISADSPKLTLDTAKEIVSAGGSFGEILSKFKEIQKYPDFVGGSGLTLIDYWLDEKGNDTIHIAVQQFSIIHSVYDDAGELIETEKLV